MSESIMHALAPYLLGEMLDDRIRYRPGSLFDQHFGLGVLNDELLHPHVATVPIHSGYYRPWRHQATRFSGTSNIQNSTDGFKVNLDVQQFKPDEISVKMVDNFVVVEGKHEERQDEHGYISRQFQRRYKLPDDVDPETIISKLSSDGVLTIEGPKKALAAPNKERVISITRTNTPAVTTGGKGQGQGQGDVKAEVDNKMDQ